MEDSLSARYLSDYIKFDQDKFDIEDYEKKLTTVEQLLNKPKDVKSPKQEKDFCSMLKKYLDRYKCFPNSNESV